MILCFRNGCDTVIKGILSHVLLGHSRNLHFIFLFVYIFIFLFFYFFIFPVFVVVVACLSHSQVKFIDKSKRIVGISNSI